jgi:hypothetical protein
MDTGARSGQLIGVVCAIRFLFLIFIVPAFAQDIETGGQSRASISPPVFSNQSSKGSKIKLDFGQQQYTSDGQTEFQRNEYMNLGVDADLKTVGFGLDAGFHGIYQGTVQSANEQYFGVPEAYFGESKMDTTGVRWTVGRQKRHWSYFDEEFGMGIWQPQLRWDYLNPIQQGLTGLFFDFAASRSVTFTFFASSLFLPDQGPNFKLRDGQFVSANRWFWSPRTNFHIFNQSNPTSYALEMPAVNEVVFQPSLGAKVIFEAPGSPWWAQAAYAYKPMNQMHLAYDCDKCMTTNLSPTATIYPSVLMHRVATLEAGLKDEDQRAWMSVTSDIPTSPKGPSNRAQSDYNDVIFAGASYAHYASLFSHPGWFKVSYMRAFENNSVQPMALVEERVESSLDRYPYKDIAALEWEWILSQTEGRQLSWRTRYTYSFPEQGSWISSQLWLQKKHWSWNLSLDILGSEIDPASSDAGLFTRYRENDRVIGGASYVF